MDYQLQIVHINNEGQLTPPHVYRYGDENTKNNSIQEIKDGKYDIAGLLYFHSIYENGVKIWERPNNNNNELS
tara:strand:+ start:594 stop:812 length:219 start_codon:yes stop_codon:yes gene_type:complete